MWVKVLQSWKVLVIGSWINILQSLGFIKTRCNHREIAVTSVICKVTWQIEHFRETSFTGRICLLVLQINDSDKSFTQLMLIFKIVSQFGANWLLLITAIIACLSYWYWMPADSVFDCIANRLFTPTVHVTS